MRTPAHGVPAHCRVVEARIDAGRPGGVFWPKVIHSMIDVPQSLVDTFQGWAHLYNKTKLVSVAVTTVHFSGLLLGGGAAVAADRETLWAAKEVEPARADHLKFLGTVHTIAITGLAMLMASGILMLLADLETFWASKAFWTKMTLVGLLVANGVVMRRAERLAATIPARAWAQLWWTSIISLVLWFAVVLASTILAATA
jgi:hypothetical protein